LTAAVPASGSRRAGRSTRPRLVVAARVDGAHTAASVEVELSSRRALGAFALAVAIFAAATVACALLGLLLAMALFGYGGVL
jgi:hypothetical protein